MKNTPRLPETTIKGKSLLFWFVVSFGFVYEEGKGEEGIYTMECRDQVAIEQP